MIRYKRYKIRAHDHGVDRHNKGVAFENKQLRLQDKHHRARSAQPPKQQTSQHPDIVQALEAELQGVVTKPKRRRR